MQRAAGSRQRHAGMHDAGAGAGLLVKDLAGKAEKKVRGYGGKPRPANERYGGKGKDMAGRGKTRQGTTDRPPPPKSKSPTR